MATALPVDPYLEQLRAALSRSRAAIVIAAPGAGKTTRVAPALVEDGAVLLLQPRRVAARSIARRIADEQRWSIGREVGWHVRFERQFSSDTQLLVATEGILTARLQQDPLLSDFRTIIIDEFHERSIHADLGLALAKQAWQARDDLRIVVMSATLDPAPLAEYLHGCPVFDIPGTRHSIAVSYRPSAGVAAAVGDLSRETDGQILCFLPGASEVRRAAGDIRRSVPPTTEVVELHGSLPAEEQDRALAPSNARRVIVATNIAETSLTVPGVRAVVDSGHHKVARYDATRGLDTLELERISRDSADQRAGRAGRLGPGVVWRLWAEADRLRPHREPEIARVDLVGPVLSLLAWGGSPYTFDWFDRPASETVGGALDLLRLLGAIEGERLTPLGRKMSALPLHPRLARILLEAGGAREAAIACALLSERQLLPRHPPTTTCDLMLERDTHDLPSHVARTARELQRAVQPDRARCSEGELRRALFTGYPDRVARRRAPQDRRVLLFSGHGATLTDESGVRDGEFLAVLDLQGGRRGDHAEARVRIASLVDREWLQPTHTVGEHVFDDDRGVVRGVEREMYGAIVLRQRTVAIDPATAAVHLARELAARPLDAAGEQLVRRLRFAGMDVPLETLAARAAAGRTRLTDARLEEGLEWREQRMLDERAPATFEAPSGRRHPLEYHADGTVTVAIKLQELFGLPETPHIGVRREPLVVVLLAPNGRPVQTTRDLRSFWTTTYQEVRKELRGRYPKHPWPEDPWNAVPTARTTKGARRG